MLRHEIYALGADVEKRAKRLNPENIYHYCPPCRLAISQRRVPTFFCPACGRRMIHRVYPSASFHGPQYFMRTGDKRPPNEFEFFLSGGLPEVYHMPKGGGGGRMAYHIMQPVLVKNVID